MMSRLLPTALLTLFLFCMSVPINATVTKSVIGEDPFNGWRPALPGWTFEFPRDHHAHPEFRTEWWYFTGHLSTPDGHLFGYQITFFRSGLIPPRELPSERSRFLQGDLKFAHFAVSDLTEGRFYHAERRARGAFGEAGFHDGSRIAWIGSWSLELVPPHSFKLQADDSKGLLPLSLELRLEPNGPLLFHGRNGVSQKALGHGNATHYYSIPRLASSGTLRLGGQTFPVKGLSWMDREWGSNLLAPHQIGWDWFSIQLTDGSCLMLFQIRDREGRADSVSGTWMSSDGATRPLEFNEIEMTPGRIWTSPKTGGRYPVEWKLSLPSLGLELSAKTPLDSQELTFGPLNYWEGAIEVSGRGPGGRVSGRGYLEMTGYSGGVIGLSGDAAALDASSAD